MTEYELKILGIDPLWKKRVVQDGRHYIVIDEVAEAEIYLIEKILFSMGKLIMDKNVFFVLQVPKNIKEKDIVLCFSETGESSINVLKLPHPSEILANSQLKKKIWLDICYFLKKIDAK
jgi:hypothetical protein